MTDRSAPSRIVPIVAADAVRRKARPGPKGRVPDPQALAEVRALLGDAPRRRDLLIEHLHRIQDSRGHISAAHLVALAQEMGLSSVEVYEVATFYHHFEVVKEGSATPPRLTVRVCDSISCAMAGAEALIDGLVSALGAECGFSAFPAWGAASGHRSP